MLFEVQKSGNTYRDYSVISIHCVVFQ